MSELTIRQEKFVNAYLNNNGNGTQAILDAGYNVANRDVAGVMSSENLRKPRVKQAIEVKRATIAEVLEQESMCMLDGLLDLAKNSKNESIRIKALTDLMDRAGYNAKKDITLSGGGTPIEMETRHTSELAKRARELLKENLTADVD